ncbi:hypothetical protein [Peribacillus kribbensis]|uniref:hypothetical protein n=1 Tax=Peribacillus kribbensis TaxID=356658 RepID=UPI0003F9CD80|nr:hypothetical protein [Peribacillus kribbensis]
MFLRLVILCMIAGAILFTVIASYISKKRNRPFNPNEGIKNASNSQQVYTEHSIDRSKQNPNNFLQ